MDIEIGQLINNRYRVDNFLGRGGMAEVYKVWDTMRATPLAMKVLHADLAEDLVFTRRFKREARTLAKLQHPNIVRFYGYERVGCFSYILMDYIEGRTLRSEIAEHGKPINPARILEIMKPLCSALQYAHNMGKVHCDIKPGNVMLKKNGDVLLTDLGIARETDAVMTATMVGFGAPAYMAPEQIRGENPTPQSDIYSLGIVLYEMLTGGKRPFTGEKAQTTGSTGEKVRWEQLKLTPPSPRKYNKMISPQVEAVVMKCLAKEPAQRYPDALALVKALERAFGGLEKPEVVIDKGPLPEWRKLEEKEAKPPRKAVKVPAWALGALGAAALVIMIVLLGWQALSGTIKLFAGEKEGNQDQTIAMTSDEIVDARGITMVGIPGGNFEMGMDADKALEICRDYRDDCERDWFINEEPVREVYVRDYYIDKYEVTNGAYRQCVVDGVCNEPEYKGSNIRDEYYGDPEYADYPVIHVSWYDAKTYCEWRGARLPTEAEWEKAARGTAGNIFPWGDGRANCRLANFYYEGSYCTGDTEEVGSYEAGASPYGVMDMAGNVWEWVSSLYEPYPYDANDGREDLNASGDRVFRGGSWLDFGLNLRPSLRYWFDSSNEYLLLGFRCAKSP